MKKNLIIGSIALILVIGAYSVYRYNVARLDRKVTEQLQKELVVAQADVVAETTKLSSLVRQSDVQYRADTAVRNGYPRANDAVISVEAAVAIDPKEEVIAALALWKKEADLALLKGTTPTALAKIRADAEAIKEYLKKIAAIPDLTPEQKKVVDDAIKEVEDVIDDFPDEEDTPTTKVIEEQKEVVKEAEKKVEEIQKKIEELNPTKDPVIIHVPVATSSNPTSTTTTTVIPDPEEEEEEIVDENWYYDAEPNSDGPELIQGSNPLYD